MDNAEFEQLKTRHGAISGGDMKGKVQFGFSRPQGGRHDDNGVVSVEFMDCASRVQFMRVEIPLAEFAKAITGMHGIEGDAEFNGLEFVGKTCVREAREIVFPGNSYDRGKLAEWLAENGAEDGWIVNTYLGSQGSVTSCEGGTRLRYSVVKYLDRTE